MFRTPVQVTPFNSEIANDFFSNITGNRYMNDDALVSTARAILPPRMAEGDSVHFQYQPKQIRPETVFEEGSEAVEAFVTADVDLSTANLVTICYLVGGQRNGDSAQYMEALQEHFVAKHRGWTENENVRVTYGRMFPILSFANVSKRSVVLFMGESDLKRQRFAIQSVFASMPWYFNAAEHPLTDDERELLLSLISKEDSEEVSKQKFYAAMDRIAAQYNFEQIRVSQMLDGFETRYEREAIEAARREVSNCDAHIANAQEEHRNWLRRRTDSLIRLAGLEMRVEESGETSAIRDLFTSNPRLYLENVEGCNLYFAVKTDLEYYDSEMLERLIANQRSWVYQGVTPRITQDDMVKLLRAVFLDHTIKLQVCGAYRLEMHGGVRALNGHDYPAGFADWMPNTHIDRFHCLGNHAPAINECISNCDYVGAIMQCIASCQSLNFGDSAVMNEFVNYLYRDRYSGFRLPDGRVVKPSVAIAWLKAQEVQGEPEEQEGSAEAEA